jgi:hypothetical protein
MTIVPEDQIEAIFRVRHPSIWYAVGSSFALAV